MADITTRVIGDTPKGSPLTDIEMDQNWLNIVADLNASRLFVKASAAITKGQVVMFDGVIGERVLAKPCDFYLPNFKPDLIMGVAKTDIALNGDGYVAWFDMLSDIDTSAYLEGDVLYADPSVIGGLTKTAPTTGYEVHIAVVTRVHAATGNIVVRPSWKRQEGAIVQAATFGATPSLTDDQAPAIQAALAYAAGLRSSSEGRSTIRVEVGEGDYRVNSTIVVPEGVTFHTHGIIHNFITDKWLPTIHLMPKSQADLLQVWGNLGSGIMIGQLEAYCDIRTDRIRLWNIGEEYDAVKGGKFGLKYQGYNFTSDQIDVDGGNIGVYMETASDVKINNALVFTASIPLKISSGTEQVQIGTFMADTPDYKACEIDSSNNIYIGDFRFFMNNQVSATGIAEGISIGQYGTVTGLRMLITGINTGGVLCKVYDLLSSRIEVNAHNSTLGTGNTTPTTKALELASAQDPSVTINVLADSGIVSDPHLNIINGLITGTAVTQSSTDTTAGRLLKVGDFGIGDTKPIVTDLNSATDGYAVCVGTALNLPSGVTFSGGISVFTWRASSITSVIQQEVVCNSPARIFRRSSSGASWQPWREIYHTDNTGTAVTADVTTSATDNTAGRLLKVGDFGIGNVGNLSLLSSFGTGTPSGVYRALGDGTPTPTTYVPVGSGNNTLSVFCANITGTIPHFIAKSNSSTAAGQKMWIGNSISGGIGWSEVYHTGNLTISSTTVNMATVAGFTGGTLYCERVGNNVTLTWTNLGHTAGTASIYGYDVIPAGYRPITSLYSTYFYDVTAARTVNAWTDGTLVFRYVDETSGVGLSSTSPGSISYKVA